MLHATGISLRDFSWHTQIGKSLEEESVTIIYPLGHFSTFVRKSHSATMPKLNISFCIQRGHGFRYACLRKTHFGRYVDLPHIASRTFFENE